MLILYAGIILMVLNAGVAGIRDGGFPITRASLIRRPGTALKKGTRETPRVALKKGHPDTALPGPQPDIRTYTYIRLVSPPGPPASTPRRGCVRYCRYRSF